MARPLRIWCPEAFYHVLSRGNERRRVFRDAGDYERFTDLLGEMSERFGVVDWHGRLERVIVEGTPGK